MPVRHDRLILSLLLCCSAPFVAVRAIASQPLYLLAQTQSAPNRKAEADQLLREGANLRLQGQFNISLDKLQQALTVYRQEKDVSGEVDALHQLAHTYNLLAKRSEAVNFMHQAIQLSQKMGNKPKEAALLNDLGWIYYFFIYDRIKGIDYYNQALTVYKTIGNRSGQAGVLTQLGWAYYGLGQTQRSLDTYNQAITLAREIGNQNAEATGLLYISQVYTSLSQSKEALDSLFRARNLFRSLGNTSEEARTFRHLGETYAHFGNTQQAIDSSLESLFIFNKLGERLAEGYLTLEIGRLYQNSGNAPKAIEFMNRSLLIRREVGERSEEARVLHEMGSLLQDQKQPELAILFYKQSVNVIEGIRKDLTNLSKDDQKTYIDTVAYNYRTLADLLLQQDRILEAQQVLDLLKVQELNDFLRNVRGNEQTARGIDNLPPEQQILAKYGELQKSAIQIGTELTDLRKLPEIQRTPAQQQRIAQLVKIQEGMDQQFNQFIDSKDVQVLVGQLSRNARKQSLDLESLSALKDDLRKAGNAVLLYPLILDDRLELILTTPDSPPIRRTVAVKREELNRTIVEFRSALKNPTSDAKVPAQKLYNWLIKPLEADLKQSGSQTLIYAPDGQLRYIPLAALFDGKQWLVERYRINNITAKSLTNLTIKPPTQPKVLAGAFGSGRYSFTVGQTSFTFNGLLGAQKEVQLLTASLPGTTTLIDSKFSRDATTTKMNEYAIVHLATHAAFVVGDPSNSFVLFGNGDRASLVDIRNWNLTNVDLIVLSACETGLGGQFGNGEEVLGLGYVFQERGARAVLASLWTVDDGGTQVLMNAFYEQLKLGNVAKVEALRQAQIALINANNKTASNGKRSSIEIEALNSGVTPNIVNRLNHPYYWAPFILIGNGL